MSELILSDTELTMSSREIAKLCNKQHAHVTRDIRKMVLDIYGGERLEALIPEKHRNRRSEYIRDKGDMLVLQLLGDDPNLVYLEYGFKWSKDTRGYVSEFYLNKELTVTLITGYRADLRYKVVKRLEELEAKQASATQLPDFNNPALAARAWAEQFELAAQAEAQVLEFKPKAKALDRLTLAEGTFNVTETAKLLDMQPKRLFAWLSANHWVYKRPGAQHWLGYQSKCNQGLVEHKTSIVQRADGSEKITEQVRITPKGLAKLSESFESALI